MPAEPGSRTITISLLATSDALQPAAQAMQGEPISVNRIPTAREDPTLLKCREEGMCLTHGERRSEATATSSAIATLYRYQPHLEEVNNDSADGRGQIRAIGGPSKKTSRPARTHKESVNRRALGPTVALKKRKVWYHALENRLFNAHEM